MKLKPIEVEFIKACCEAYHCSDSNDNQWPECEIALKPGVRRGHICPARIPVNCLKNLQKVKEKMSDVKN